MSDTEVKKVNPFALALKDIFAGSAAGVAQCLSGHPLDTVKVRMQTQPTNVTPLKYQGTIHAFKTIIKEEGTTAIYKGVQSPLVGMALMNSVLFLSYGQARAFIQKGDEELSIPQLSLVEHLLDFQYRLWRDPLISSNHNFNLKELEEPNLDTQDSSIVQDKLSQITE